MTFLLFSGIPQPKSTAAAFCSGGKEYLSEIIGICAYSDAFSASTISIFLFLADTIRLTAKVTPKVMTALMI